MYEGIFVFGVQFLKYFMYMLIITGDYGAPIAKPSSCWYMPDCSWKNVVCTQNVNISIKLLIGMLVRSIREWFDSNLFRTTDRASYVGNLVNRLTVRWASNCYRCGYLELIPLIIVNSFLGPSSTNLLRLSRNRTINNWIINQNEVSLDMYSATLINRHLKMIGEHYHWNVILTRL